MAPQDLRQNTTLADFIWKNADDLWGPFKHVEFGKIILPFTLLRRLECVLEPTRDQVQEAMREFDGQGIAMGPILQQAVGYSFYNTSTYSLATLGATRTRQNLDDYISSFSPNARVIFEQFDFANTITRMDRAGVLYKICKNFAGIDLHPDTVPERVMSNIYGLLDLLPGLSSFRSWFCSGFGPSLTGCGTPAG